MGHVSTRHEPVRPLVLAMVALLGLALVLCLVHVDHHETSMHVAQGACAAALVPSCVMTAVVLASLSWWSLSGPTISPYSVSLHLPDPPPKSSPLR